MDRRPIFRVAWALLWVLVPLLSACREPDSVERFLRRDAVPDGLYVYTLPLTDTTAAYDFWFYTRSERDKLDNFRLDVRWTAPSGESFTETVYMHGITPQGSRELYRSGMVPAQAGEWRLSVRPQEADEIFGLGLICKKHDGTR